MRNSAAHCFHCQALLPHNNPLQFSAIINQETRYFCCPACLAVASTIHNLGLEQYYRQRDNKPQQPSNTDVLIIDAAAFDTVVRVIDKTLCEVQLFIPDIHCTSCCWLIEKRLQQLTGITKVQAQFHSHKLTLHWHQDQLPLDEILRILQDIGYRATPWQPTRQQSTTNLQQKKLLQRLGVAGLLALQIHMVAMGGYFGADSNMQQWLNVVALLLSIPVWFYCADIFFHNANRSIRNLLQRNRDTFVINMDVPIAVAIIAAAIASIIAVIQRTDDVYFDSIAMFVFLLLGARFLEARARNRLAEYAQEPLLPQTCIRLHNKQRENISIHSLQINDCVVVETGIIPIDGDIISGSAAIEQAVITGEFLPVQKQAGDTVLAGTTLLNGKIIVQAKHWGADSHIAHLHQRMEQAFFQKQQRHFTARTMYDRVAQIFTPTVLLLATLSALYWWWADASKALPSFLAVLVASCPCALTLAAPTALTAATLRLRQYGILITSSHVLKILPAITQYVFDKTGTLTQGRMHISHIQLFGTHSEEECVAIAAAMERNSTHPIASAFHTAQRDNTFFTVDKVQSVLHCGIEAKKDHVIYRLGKQDWACAEENIVLKDNMHDTIPLFLSENSKLLAIFYLGDPLRTTATQCINALQKDGIQCTIASGDNSNAVDAVARTLNINTVHRHCSPNQKVQIIETLRQQQKVLMVGDGINDGPVLAHADVSVALADASKTAQLAADVILLNNQLNDLLQLRTVALHTRTIVRQNLSWALVYNVGILPLAATGWLTPVNAAIGMAISSLLVTINALRLLPRTRRLQVETL